MEYQDDIREILKYLPHRYPFLLLDRVLEFDEEAGLKAIKNITFNEPIFTGHFPQAPIYPGVLILEGMAQACALHAFKTLGGYPSEETLYLLAGIDKARFKQQVVPGDQIHFEVVRTKSRQGISRYDCVATVDGNKVCSSEVIIAKNEIEL